MKKITLVLAIIAANILIYTASCSLENKSENAAKSVDIDATIEQSTTEAETETPVPQSATKIGKSVQGKNFKITLTSAKLYDEIKEGELSSISAPGTKYLVLFLDAKNISPEGKYISMNYYDSYVDGKRIEFDLFLAKPEGYNMFNGDVESGKTLSGCVICRVPENWKKLEFTYKDGTLDKGENYKFVVDCSDIKK